MEEKRQERVASEQSPSTQKGGRSRVDVRREGPSGVANADWAQNRDERGKESTTPRTRGGRPDGQEACARSSRVETCEKTFE